MAQQVFDKILDREQSHHPFCFSDLCWQLFLTAGDDNVKIYSGRYRAFMPNVGQSHNKVF
jgi:hypothetical protein